MTTGIEVTPRALIGLINVHLLNTAILPVQAPAGEYVLLDCTTEEARVLTYAAIQGENDGGGPYLGIHIGHDATAQVVSAALGTRINVDRSPWDGTGVGLACQLLGRAPEGVILSREEMEAIGWKWRVIVRKDIATEAIERARLATEALHSLRRERGLDPETGEKISA